MNLAAIIATIEQFAPLIVEVADALHLNKLAADLLRKLIATLNDAARKSPTPVDDIVMAMASGLLNHVADLLEQGAVKDALSLLGAIGKLAPVK